MNEDKCHFYGNRLVDEKYCKFKHIGICRSEMQTIKKKKYDITNNIYTFFTEKKNKNGIRLKIDGEKDIFDPKHDTLEQLIDITYKKKNRDGTLIIYTNLNKKGIFINGTNAKYFDKVTSIYIILPKKNEMDETNELYESVDKLLSEKDKYTVTKTSLCYPTNKSGSGFQYNPENTECSLIKENTKSSGVVKVKQLDSLLNKDDDKKECIRSYIGKDNKYIKNSDYIKTFNKIGCPNINLPIHEWREKENKDVIKEMSEICINVKDNRRSGRWEKDMCCGSNQNCKPKECKILQDILDNNSNIPESLICPEKKPSCVGHKIQNGVHIRGTCYNINQSACKQIEFHKNILAIGYLYIIPYENNIWWLPHLNVCNNIFKLPWQNKIKVDQVYFNGLNLPKVGKDIQCSKLKKLLDNCELSFSQNKDTDQMFVRKDKGSLKKYCKLKINNNNSVVCNKFNNNWFEAEGSYDNLEDCQEEHADYVKKCNTQNIDMEYIECNGKKNIIKGIGNILVIGQKLNIGESLISINRKFKLVFEEDGNLCLYTNYPKIQMLWCLRDDANSSIRTNFRHIMKNILPNFNKNKTNLQFKFKSNLDLGIVHEDSDNVIFSFADFYWTKEYINVRKNLTRTSRLVLQDDGNIIIITKNNIVWKLFNWFDNQIKRMRHHPIIDFPLTYYKRCYFLEDNNNKGVWDKNCDMHEGAQWIWYLPNAHLGAAEQYHSEEMLYAYLSSNEINAKIYISIDDFAEVFANNQSIGTAKGNYNLINFKIYKGLNKIIVKGVNWSHRAGCILSVYNKDNNNHLFSSNTDWRYRDGTVPDNYNLNWNIGTGYSNEINIKRNRSYLKKW